MKTYLEVTAQAKFEVFVAKLVNRWRQDMINEQNLTMADGTSTVQRGADAEEYIIKKIENMSNSYLVCRSSGSRSPADVFALHKHHKTADNKGFWHLMLIQVKSSRDKNSIARLDDSDKENLKNLATLAEELIQEESWYGRQPLFISTGYAGVWRIGQRTVRHNLQNTEFFERIELNKGDIRYGDIKSVIQNAHSLSI